MKIGIDCRLINKAQNTGISRYTEFLIEYYIERYGEQNVFLISNNETFKFLNCTVIYTKLKPFNILHFLRFSKFLNKIDLDLFHAPFYSFGTGKPPNTFAIVTVHDLMYKFVKDFFGSNTILNNLKISYFDFIVKNSLTTANKIVSVSNTTKNDVKKIFGLDSTHIVEDSEIEVKEDFLILDRFKLEKKGFYFYCGNCRPHKNINFIVEIFKSNPNLPPLVLAGKGHQNDRNVIATGIVSEEELKALYKAAIAFVFPSKYEGFGLPVLESFRAGTFVIASKIPAFLEFESPNIFYFDLDSEDQFFNAIKSTLSNNFDDDKTLLARFSKDQIYESYDKIITELLIEKK